MKQSIKEDFRNFQVPKGTTITVNEEDIEITSTNTNYYTISCYIFLFLIVLGISLATSEILVLVTFGTPFLVLILLNLFSKVEIRLSNAFIEIKDGFFLRHDVQLSHIEKITFGGASRMRSNRFGSSPSVPSTCTHILLKSGKTLNVFKSAENQKFMFRCISYFVEEQ